MDRGSAFGHVCSCGRQFTQPGHLKTHQKACRRSRQRLSTALAKAKAHVAIRNLVEASLEPPVEPANVDNDILPDDEVPEHGETAQVALVLLHMFFSNFVLCRS